VTWRWGAWCSLSVTFASQLYHIRPYAHYHVQGLPRTPPDGSTSTWGGLIRELALGIVALPLKLYNEAVSTEGGLLLTASRTMLFSSQSVTVYTVSEVGAASNLFFNEERISYG
jgi:hypothetical protein